MLMTQLETQGMSSHQLRMQAVEVMSTLTDEQLLVVIAYSRMLLGEMAARHKAHALESLVEEPF
jgi:hypothetical protein